MKIKSRFLPLILALLVLAACQPSTPVVLNTPTAITPPKETKGPFMNGFLKPYGADGERWPPNVEVTIQVYDQPQGKVLFTGQATTDNAGHFYQDVGVTTLPGMMVAVTYGQETQSTVLVPLAITTVDAASDTVSGTATPGAAVVLFAVDAGRSEVLETTTSGAGQWQADFGGRLDLTESTVVQAIIQGANGNGTVYKTSPK